MLLALLLMAQTLQVTPCTSPAHRAFDFWIGDWDVFDVNGTEPSADVVVESILGGCVATRNTRAATGSVARASARTIRHAATGSRPG